MFCAYHSTGDSDYASLSSSICSSPPTTSPKVTLPYEDNHKCSSSGQQITQFGFKCAPSAEVQAHIDPVLKPGHTSATHPVGQQTSHSTTFLSTTQDSNATDGETSRCKKKNHVKTYSRHTIPADKYSNLTQTYTHCRRSTEGFPHRHIGPQVLKQSGSPNDRTNSTLSSEGSSSPSFTPLLPKSTSQITHL